MVPLSEVFKLLIQDCRIGPAHISMYLALLQCKERINKEMPFLIRKEELMRLSKVRSRTRYYGIMKELDEWGYIEYWPSYKNAGKSKVFVVGVGGGATRGDDG